MLAAHANPATATVDLLVVDPDATAPELERPGFSLRLAKNAETALPLLKRTLPHVLVLDLVLPDRDGLDLCQAAISSHTRPHVLVTTGAVERIPAALRIGCDSVLVKPYEPSLLFTRIGRLLRCDPRPSVTAGGRQVGGRFVGPWNTGTNRLWPTLECPGCRHEGSVRFDYASYRRMWCACLTCNHVWVAARRE
jgi:CheY-like chemotaxis protein